MKYWHDGHSIYFGEGRSKQNIIVATFTKYMKEIDKTEMLFLLNHGLEHLEERSKK